MEEFTNSMLHSGIYCQYSCFPPKLEELREGHEESVAVNVTCTEMADQEIHVYLQPQDQKYIEIPQPWVNFNYSDGGFNFTVKGREFGRTFVLFNQTFGRDDFRYEVGVVRPSNMALDIAFAVVLASMLVFINTGFGCNIRMGMVKENLKKPVAPVLGFCCQFLIMAPASILSINYLMIMSLRVHAVYLS